MDQPLDFVAHASLSTIIGAFRCPRNHPRFVDSGPIQNDIFVFPRSSVRIRHAGGPAFIADQTRATIYNRGQIYDRGAVSDEGDRSDWFAVPREVAIEAVIANGLEPTARGPFPFAFAPISNRTYLEQRRLFQWARRGGDPEGVDEAIYGLLDEVVRSAAAAREKQATRRSVADARRLAEEIRQLISPRPDEPWSLSRLQDHFGISAFRLCRAFRRATGSSIHAYLVSLRVRASLERIEPPATDLAAVAMDLGFSSHSHFTLTFRRSFGLSPSACRSGLAPARF
jgi:AraC family transcriptional regulator